MDWFPIKLNVDAVKSDYAWAGLAVLGALLNMLVWFVAAATITAGAAFGWKLVV